MYEYAAIAATITILLGLILGFQASSFRPVSPSGLFRGFRKRGLAMELARSDVEVDLILGSGDWNRKVMRWQQVIDFFFIASYLTTFLLLARIAAQQWLVWGLSIGILAVAAAVSDVIEDIGIIGVCGGRASASAINSVRRAATLKWFCIFLILIELAPLFWSQGSSAARFGSGLLALSGLFGVIVILKKNGRLIEHATGFMSLALLWTSGTLLAVAVFAQTPTTTAPKYETLNSVLWVQRSVEYAGVVAETYHTAERMLPRAIEDKHWTAELEQTGRFEDLPPAVILDLDETVLDNSPFMARLVLSGQAYTETRWKQWVGEAKAQALPGAVRFLNKAFFSGVMPIYISNRVCRADDPADPTLRVLRQLGIPVSPERLLCRSKEDDPADKSLRRALAARSFRILMLFGDDLTDFISVPKEASTIEGRAELFPIYEQFMGERWFVIPNPMYGSWERAIGLDVEAKLKALRR